MSSTPPPYLRTHPICKDGTGEEMGTSVKSKHLGTWDEVADVLLTSIKNSIPALNYDEGSFPGPPNPSAIELLRQKEEEGRKCRENLPGGPEPPKSEFGRCHREDEPQPLHDRVRERHEGVFIQEEENVVTCSVCPQKPRWALPDGEDTRETTEPYRATGKRIARWSRLLNTLSGHLGSVKHIDSAEKYENLLTKGFNTMGIKQLSKVIADISPGAIKQGEMKNYFGRTIAVDASMCLYQFLIAVRNEGSFQVCNCFLTRPLDPIQKNYYRIRLTLNLISQNPLVSIFVPSPNRSFQMTDANGEITSHIIGVFYRTIRMMDNGLKPVYVFDGKPPTMKGGELAKRTERREEAAKELAKAEAAQDQENIDKFSKRLVRVEKHHAEEVKQLLKLMGVPYVNAPCEAEAQCAELVKKGKCFGVGTEDMDALTFGANKLVRHLTFSESRKIPVQEFDLAKVLSESGLSMDQFIDLCILLGCDYCDTIKGIGPKKALTLITEHGSIEEILKKIDQTKYPPPEDWPFDMARKLFQNFRHSFRFPLKYSKARYLGHVTGY
eukprot:sb/3463588/